MADTLAYSLPALAPAGPKPLRAWMLGGIALLAVAVYANSTRNGFALDDVAIVRDNARVLNLEWTNIWKEGYWGTIDGRVPDALYRPLTIWSYLANQALTPGQAWAFHVTNVLLHAVVSVLVALLAWRILRDRAVAVVTGVLFAVHPLHTEAVANTVGRAELLASLWSLLALLLFLPANLDEPHPARRRWYSGLLVAACFLAAILCKETPAALLVAFVAIDVWRWLRFAPGRPSLVRWAGTQTLRYYLPLAGAFAGYLAMRLQAVGLMTNTRTISHIVNPLVIASPGERAVTPFMLLAKYLGLTFYPVTLSADYSSPSILPTANPTHPLAALGILVCLLAIVLSIKLWRKAPHLVLILALFATSYALVSNFIRIGTIFGERLFYLPSTFVLMLVAWAAVAAVRRAEKAGRQPAKVARWGLASVTFAVAVLCSIRCYVRNQDWSDNLALAISTARDNTDSGKACAWAGANLLLVDMPEYKTFGVQMLERGIELSPDYAQARWELAKYYGIRGELGKSILYLTQAARLDPGAHFTRNAMTASLTDLRQADPATYMPVLEAYYQEHPREDAVHLALAMAYHAQGKFDLAEKFAREALVLGHYPNPQGSDQYHEAAAELASIFFDRGDVEMAVKEFAIYQDNLKSSIDARLQLASMMLALDPRKHPGAMPRVAALLAEAQAMDPGNAQLKKLRTQYNQASRGSQHEAATASVVAPESRSEGSEP